MTIALQEMIWHSFRAVATDSLCEVVIWRKQIGSVYSYKVQYYA